MPDIAKGRLDDSRLADRSGRGDTGRHGDVYWRNWICGGNLTQFLRVELRKSFKSGGAEMLVSFHCVIGSCLYARLKLAPPPQRAAQQLATNILLPAQPRVFVLQL